MYDGKWCGFGVDGLWGVVVWWNVVLDGGKMVVVGGVGGVDGEEVGRDSLDVWDVVGVEVESFWGVMVCGMREEMRVKIEFDGMFGFVVGVVVVDWDVEEMDWEGMVKRVGEFFEVVDGGGVVDEKEGLRYGGWVGLDVWGCVGVWVVGEKWKCGLLCVGVGIVVLGG